MDKDKKEMLLDVEESIRSIEKIIKKGDAVILRSTIPIGGSRKIALPILEELSGLKGGEDFHFIYAAERTVEGTALKETRTLPPIVSGINQASIAKEIEIPQDPEWRESLGVVACAFHWREASKNGNIHERALQHKPSSRRSTDCLYFSWTD